MSLGVLDRKREMEYTQRQLAAAKCITRKATPEEIDKMLNERGNAMGKRGPKPGSKRDKRVNINELADQAIIQVSKQKDLAKAVRENIEAEVEAAPPVTEKTAPVTEKAKPVTKVCGRCRQETPIDGWDYMANRCERCAAHTTGAIIREDQTEFNSRKEQEDKLAKSMEDAVDATAYALYGMSYADFKTKKPPLGLTPKWLHDEKRMYEITKAVARYSEAGVPVPFEWMEELESLIGPVLNRIRDIYSTTQEEAQR